MDQSNTVTYYFIANSLAAEAASLGGHPPSPYPQDLWTSTIVANKYQRAASREQVVQYSPGFTQIGLSYQTERSNLFSTRGSDSTSRAEISASTFTRKIEQG